MDIGAFQAQGMSIGAFQMAYSAGGFSSAGNVILGGGILG